MRPPSLPRSAADLLPHRAPMFLLDEVAEYRDGAVRANATITEENAFANADGRLEAVALIEILAQAAAALRGCEAEVDGDGEQRLGFLVGLKRLRISSPARVGDSLSVEVRRTAGLGQAIVMEGRVYRGDDCLAEGTLNVWEEVASAILSDSGPAGVAETPTSQVLVVTSGLECMSPMHRAVCACASAYELNADKSEAVGEFRFGESFAGFQGHFPGFSILPGIVMLKIALLLSEGLTGCRAELVGVDRAKFSGQVRPGQPIRARVRVSYVGEQWRIAAAIVNSRTDAPVFKLNATAERMEDHPLTIRP